MFELVISVTMCIFFVARDIFVVWERNQNSFLLQWYYLQKVILRKYFKNLLFIAGLFLKSLFNCLIHLESCACLYSEGADLLRRNNNFPDILWEVMGNI